MSDIKIQNLTVQYYGMDEGEKALDHVSLDIKQDPITMYEQIAETYNDCRGFNNIACWCVHVLLFYKCIRFKIKNIYLFFVFK